MHPKLSDIRRNFLTIPLRVGEFLQAATEAQDQTQNAIDWFHQPNNIKQAVETIAGPDGGMFVDLLSIWNDLADEDRTLVKSLIESRTSLVGRKTFGEKLTWLRKAAGMSQRQLAEKAEVPLATIRNFEQGRTGRVTLTVAVRLAKVFGRSVATFQECDGVDLRKPKAVRKRKAGKAKA